MTGHHHGRTLVRPIGGRGETLQAARPPRLPITRGKGEHQLCFLFRVCPESKPLLMGLIVLPPLLIRSCGTRDRQSAPAETSTSGVLFIPGRPPIPCSLGCSGLIVQRPIAIADASYARAAAFESSPAPRPTLRLPMVSPATVGKKQVPTATTPVARSTSPPWRVRRPLPPRREARAATANPMALSRTAVEHP